MRKSDSKQEETIVPAIKTKKTRQNKVEHFKVALLGPPKVGKTIAAMTLSQHFDPSKFREEWQSLDDTLLLEVDGEGDMSLTADKIDVEVVNVTELIRKNGQVVADLPKRLKELWLFTADQVVNHGKRLVVLDTPSELGRNILEYYSEVNPPRNSKGYIDGFAIPKLDGYLHGNVHENLMGFPCHVVFCIHTKLAGKAYEDKSKADGMISQDVVDTIMDFRYMDSGNIYRRNMSLIASIQTDRRGERAIYPLPNKGFEAGSRFNACLDKKEPANLSELLAKINNHLQKGTES